MREKRLRRKIRHFRIRNKVNGSSVMPRLAVFRSNEHIYVQIIDDQDAKTLAFASDLELRRGKTKTGEKKNKTDIARLVGLEIAKKGVAKKIKKVTFDRAGYKFHGRVKALAVGAREGGLKF